MPGVKNFATVDAGSEALYRGAQPSRRGIETLKDMGVKTVIDLRNDPEPWERKHVTAAGMKYVHVPTDAKVNDPVRIAQFLVAVRTAERPIFVHCRRGRDRTGLEIAVYRMVEQAERWTREAAIAELRRHGYHWLMFPNIQRFVSTFDPQDFVAAADQAAALVGADGDAGHKAGSDSAPQGN